jgi:hypothetical protein
LRVADHDAHEYQVYADLEGWRCVTAGDFPAGRCARI